MTSTATAQALIDWARVHLPALVTDQQVRSAPESEWPLPDVACAIVRTTHRKGRVQGRTQQGTERVRTCQLVLACEPASDGSDSTWLYESVDMLMDELSRDRTLQGRVAAVSVAAEATYEPPFIELEDGGATARQATLTLTVFDPVAA